MSKYERCPDSVLEMAAAILCKYEDHKPILDAKVRIDYLFAFPEKDEDGNYIGDAMTHDGVKAIGLTRQIGSKDRAAGRGDAEILLDGEWWTENEEVTDDERRALLDHELHHLEVRKDDDGLVCVDNIGRPKLKMRKHDRQIGWFDLIAARHKNASQEVIQARTMMDKAGQIYWPDLFTAAVPA